MKKLVLRTAAFALLLAVLLLPTSCRTLYEMLENAQEQSSGAAESIAPATNGTESRREAENVIPFYDTPEITPCSLPEEVFDDPIEQEASALIDGAIARAISYVNAMKDDRHSSVSFSFDEDANGYISALNEREKELFDRFTAAGEERESLTVTDKEYGEDLKHAYFALFLPLKDCRADLDSFMFLDAKTRISADYETTFYKSVFNVYYDPYMDGNTRVDGESVKHAAALLDHVVKRIVRFMPERLSVYDRYYYLAAVLCERIDYDNRPRNCSTAFGALISGKAVCEGYAKAFCLLCREAGLWCAYRTGLPRGVGHEWNMIRLESGIYNVDVTWCDTAAKPYEEKWYEYFVKTDDDFEENGHSITEGVPSTGQFEPCPYETYPGDNS